MTPKPFLKRSKLPASTAGSDKDIQELLEWRICMLAGYCSSTGKPHRLADFQKKNGILSKVHLTDGYVCENCGVLIDEESYSRLKELELIEENLHEISRRVIISTEE